MLVILVKLCLCWIVGVLFLLFEWMEFIWLLVGWVVLGLKL